MCLRLYWVMVRWTMCGVLVTTGAAWGQAGMYDCDPIPGTLDSLRKEHGQKLNGLLREKKFAALDDDLNDRLRRYRGKQYNDLLILWAVEGLAEPKPENGPLLEQWVRERPTSAFARLALASHHIRVGFARRGIGVIANTSREQLEGMTKEFGIAAAMLKPLMQLDGLPGLSHALLLDMLGAAGSKEAFVQALHDAEAKDPLGMSWRHKAMFMLNPKWGGSVEAIDAVVHRAKAKELPARQIRYLEYAAEAQKADFHDNLSREKTRAIEHYRKANAICADPLMLWKASGGALALEDWALVVRLMDEYLVVKPVAAAYNRRGWARDKAGQLPEAVPDYERAAALNDPWAQGRLGYLLMLGRGIPQDVVRARKLLGLAAAAGNAHAQRSLDWLNRPGSAMPATLSNEPK